MKSRRACVPALVLTVACGLVGVSVPAPADASMPLRAAATCDALDGSRLAVHDGFALDVCLSGDRLTITNSMKTLVVEVQASGSAAFAGRSALRHPDLASGLIARTSAKNVLPPGYSASVQLGPGKGTLKLTTPASANLEAIALMTLAPVLPAADDVMSHAQHVIDAASAWADEISDARSCLKRASNPVKRAVCLAKFGVAVTGTTTKLAAKTAWTISKAAIKKYVTLLTYAVHVDKWAALNVKEVRQLLDGGTIVRVAAESGDDGGGNSGGGDPGGGDPGGDAGPIVDPGTPIPGPGKIKIYNTSGPVGIQTFVTGIVCPTDGVRPSSIKVTSSMAPQYVANYLYLDPQGPGGFYDPARGYASISLDSNLPVGVSQESHGHVGDNVFTLECGYGDGVPVDAPRFDVVQHLTSPPIGVGVSPAGPGPGDVLTVTDGGGCGDYATDDPSVDLYLWASTPQSTSTIAIAYVPATKGRWGPAALRIPQDSPPGPYTLTWSCPGVAAGVSGLDFYPYASTLTIG